MRIVVVLLLAAPLLLPLAAPTASALPSCLPDLACVRDEFCFATVGACVEWRQCLEGGPCVKPIYCPTRDACPPPT